MEAGNHGVGPVGSGPRLMPATAFDRRLDLLESSGQVSPQARRLTMELVERVERAFGLSLDEANGAMLVTHLAMSLSRLEGGAVDVEVPAPVREAIEGRDRELAFMRSALAACGDALGRPIPEVEVLYMTAHLCAVLERTGS
jgi:transcriptional regulatory protein LevR